MPGCIVYQVLLLHTSAILYVSVESGCHESIKAAFLSETWARPEEFISSFLITSSLQPLTEHGWAGQPRTQAERQNELIFLGFSLVRLCIREINRLTPKTGGAVRRK